MEQRLEAWATGNQTHNLPVSGYETTDLSIPELLVTPGERSPDLCSSLELASPQLHTAKGCQDKVLSG